MVSPLDIVWSLVVVASLDKSSYDRSRTGNIQVIGFYLITYHCAIERVKQIVPLGSFSLQCCFCCTRGSRGFIVPCYSRFLADLPQSVLRLVDVHVGTVLSNRNVALACVLRWKGGLCHGSWQIALASRYYWVLMQSCAVYHQIGGRNVDFVCSFLGYDDPVISADGADLVSGCNVSLQLSTPALRENFRMTRAVLLSPCVSLSLRRTMGNVSRIYETASGGMWKRRWSSASSSGVSSRGQPSERRAGRQPPSLFDPQIQVEESGIQLASE